MSQAESHPYQAYFEASLAKSLARYEERVGEAFPVPVKIECVSDDGFWAYAKGGSDRLKLDVSAGALDHLRRVCDTVMQLSEALPPEQRVALLDHKDHAIETSFAWLLQHELNHHAIGHFDLIDGAALAEGQSPHGLGVVQRTAKSTSRVNALTKSELAELHMCLELQTDHDATEIVLGAYARENWPLFQ